LHLPGLNARDEVMRLEQAMRADYHLLEGYRGPLKAGLGELYMVSNRATLGRTEEEICFYLRNAVRDLVAKERDARKEMTNEGSRSLEDRIGRAQGIARGARVLEYDEAMRLMSPLRLGTALGLLEGYSLRMLNELEMASQRAHVELRTGQKADPFALSAERADMFRARLS
ncbi:MAG: ATP--guanido phosphotransferase, partial [Candidatus Hydrogenedentes bacterium]|nr:ATP--guanido phosphotransferase [Candidatus Hydrogenedentota bacterium]